MGGKLVCIEDIEGMVGVSDLKSDSGINGIGGLFLNGTPDIVVNDEALAVESVTDAVDTCEV